MLKSLCVGLSLFAWLALSVQAQTVDATDADEVRWQKSVHGFVWAGNRYWESTVNATADERSVLQGGVNIVLQKRQTKVVGKVWLSVSPEKTHGKHWTGNAQELDLGLELQQALAKGLVAKVGYSHFFITKSAGSDVEMVVLAVSKETALTEKNVLVGTFEFYQFLPTSSKGPAGGQFYLPSVAFSRTSGKWNTTAGLAVVRNSNGAFGLRSETAVRFTGQVLYKLHHGQTGPDVTYGGVPQSQQRPMRTTFGWSWVF